MKSALFLLLAVIADCGVLGAANPFIPLPGFSENPILDIVLPVVNEANALLSKFVKCLHTALTENLTAAADAVAKFICADAKHKIGQLDVEHFKVASEEFRKALEKLGCVSPLSDIIGGVDGNVEELKRLLVEFVKNNPVIAKAVLLACPFKVLFEGYRDLFGGNYTTC